MIKACRTCGMMIWNDCDVYWRLNALFGFCDVIDDIGGKREREGERGHGRERRRSSSSPASLIPSAGARGRPGSTSAIDGARADTQLLPAGEDDILQITPYASSELGRSPSPR